MLQEESVFILPDEFEMIRIKQKGDFNKTEKYLNKIKDPMKNVDLDRYGELGVQALMNATPVDTGLTAASWTYRIEKTRTSTKLQFFNSNIQNGVPIAIILQYGHATRNGGYVAGRDYINPAARPIFDALAREAWEEVSKV